ncbi:MAG: zinc ABC transporter substrate-binding protein [Clostridiales bacterium]|nr:zinc ABC transporter substrate-binding protein [Clostridiales bacterium]
MKRFVSIMCVLSCVMLSACVVNNDKKFTTNKIKVCTSFCTVYDFVQKIGGDKVEIVNIVPYGVEPHDWEPNPKDLVLIKKANLLICNGNGMETWLDKIRKSVKNIEVVEASKGVNLIEGDPHVWLDPMNAKIELKNICDALVRLDSKNEEYYRKNYSKYSQNISELDNEYTEKLYECTKKEVVVMHAAFGYMCNRYGLEQIALQGVANEGEPSIKRISEIIRVVRDRNIGTIFAENSADEKIMRTISQETKVKISRLQTLENMSEEGIKNGQDYFGIMRRNLDELVLALR